MTRQSSPALTRLLLAFLVAWACSPLQGFAQGDRVAGGGEATPVTAIRVPENFKVELLRSAMAGEGSWISMTLDDRGRWIFARDRVGLIRLTMPDGEEPIRIEVINDELRHCRGLLYAYESLYVSATNSKGFYRLRDTTGDDRFDEVKLLKTFDYKSRYGHGTNQVVLGPDGMIYLVVGNDVGYPQGISPSSPYRNAGEDQLLPNPHDAGQEFRVGYILRTDPDGQTWEVIAGGLRNQFDIAFNPDGEMFTFDADMEWDVGLPWYRPTRVHHIVSGGEYGWRWGTGKWPAYLPDHQPSTVDVGLGSPTGLVFGVESHFPAPYRDALFMGEWQNGRILMAHLVPEGGSYKGRFDSFIEGAPLNVCDLHFGLDGALYFITGGRRSQSGFYRVSFVGQPPKEAPPLVTEQQKRATRARALRRKLESYHMVRDPAAVDLAWRYLGSDDYSLRHAARIAIENQDLRLWRGRALTVTHRKASLTALLALVRAGRREDQRPLLASLGRLSLGELDRGELLGALRVYALSFIRQGRPDAEGRDEALRQLDPLYPHESVWVNQELCELLLYLGSPRSIERTLALLATAASHEEQIHYAMTLSRTHSGWTTETRRAIFEWLIRTRTFRGRRGKLFPAAIKAIASDVKAQLNEDERSSFADVLAAVDAALSADQAEGVPPEALKREVVKQWKVADLLGDLEKVSKGRSYVAGKRALRAVQCLTCHRFGEEGRATGPDLSHVGRRFDARAILESILDPSAVVDEKYRPITYVLDDGRVVTGLTVKVSADEFGVETDPLTGTTVLMERARIVKSFPSSQSPMPSGLADTLTREEILDLIALLRADLVP